MDAVADTVHFQRHNFFRGPDWRWQLATRAAAGGRALAGRQADAETVAAARFLRAEARCRTDRSRARLGETWRPLLAARRLAKSDGPLAFEVRARVLARQTGEKLAARCGLVPDAVRWFEALLFNVRDRLQSRDWVAKVIGPGTWQGFAPEEMGRLWMAVAYHGGPLALEAVLAVTGRDGRRGRGAGRNFPPAVLRSAELFVAALMLPADAPLGRLAGLREQTRLLTQRPRPEGVPDRLARAAGPALGPPGVAPAETGRAAPAGPAGMARPRRKG